MKGTINVYGHTNLQNKQINVHTSEENTTFIHYRGLSPTHLRFLNSAEKIKLIKKRLSSISGNVLNFIQSFYFKSKTVTLM